MKINNQDINVDDLLKGINLNENLHSKYGNDIYLSAIEIEILKKNNFDYQKYVNVKDLIFDLEEFIEEQPEENDEIEWVLNNLSEFNYYYNINK